MAPSDNVLNTNPQYVKLTKLAMVQIADNVKNENFFSMLVFMKSKLFNMFIAHLPLVMRMFAQQFYTLQISCMQNILNNDEHHVINIAMMARHWAI